jgi:hypothetical protein
MSEPLLPVVVADGDGTEAAAAATAAAVAQLGSHAVSQIIV